MSRSRKLYLTGSRSDIHVPMREVALSGGEPPLVLYDTSGPYTDPDAHTDIKRGLSPLRLPWVMARGDVDLVVTGADRIAANGDTANKIGTYSLAVLAAHHRVPFYIAAPFSTIDPTLASGAEIPIEERDASEVRRVGAQPTAPGESPVFNPAFDVTPAGLIAAIITERGVFRAPYSFRR